jgi:hypothetical protein
MKKKTYLAVIAALGFSVFSGKLQAQNQPQSWDARITFLKGSVDFYPAKSPQQGYAAVPGLPLESGDRIVTNADGQAQIAFNGSGVISLAPNSSLTVKALSQAKTSLFLGLGNIIAKFDHLLSAQNLQVQTPMAVAAIRGTEFGVGVSPKRVSKIGVFDEGKVEVTNHSGHQFLKPHQELSVKSKNEKLPHPHPLRYFLKYKKQMLDVRKSLASVHLKWKQKHKDVFRQSGPNRHAVRKSFMRQMRKLGRQGRRFHVQNRNRRRHFRPNSGQ